MLEGPIDTAPLEKEAKKAALNASRVTKRTMAAIQCPVELSIRVIGGKWKPVILWHLRDQKKRFGELRREIKGITVKMLAQQLRELEQDGIIDRKVFYEVPPRVEYSLTQMGRDLDPVLFELAKWGQMFRTKMGLSSEASCATKTVDGVEKAVNI